MHVFSQGMQCIMLKPASSPSPSPPLPVLKNFLTASPRHARAADGGKAGSHRQRVEADTLSPQNEQDARAGSSSSSCIASRRRRPLQPPAPPSPPLPLPWLPRPRPIGQCQAKPDPLVQPSPRTVPMAIPPTLLLMSPAKDEKNTQRI